MALIAIHIVLKQSYYLVMATQLVLPWLLYVWLARNGPVGVFLSWMWSSIVSYILMTGWRFWLHVAGEPDDGCGGRMHHRGCSVSGDRDAPLGDACKGRTPTCRFRVLLCRGLQGHAAIFQVNCLLESSSITIYRPVVLEKVYGFRTRGLLVESWSPDQRLSAAALLIRPGAAMVPPSRETF